MTQDEFISKQKFAIEQLKNGTIMGIAVADTHAKMTARIFEDGKKSDGSDIGKYAGGPMYVNPLLSPKKFPVKGKPNKKGVSKNKFESTGQPHRTGYFENYKAYREKIGRPTDKVNLVLSGTLHSDFGNGIIKKDDSHYIVSAKNERNKKIINGAEEKYGDIFTLSSEEVFNFLDVFNFEFERALKNA